MTDKTLKSTENKANLVRTTVRMNPELHQRFTDYVHERGRGLPPRKRPSMDAVIQEAIEAKLSSPVNAGSKAVPKSEQTVTCPHCESTLSVSREGIAEVMEPGSVPIAEKRIDFHSTEVPSEIRDWLNLVTSAVHVEDPDWREMLGNIKTQLEQVATVADREQERKAGTGVRRGSSGGAADLGAGGRGSDRAAKPRRKKAS